MSSETLCLRDSQLLVICTGGKVRARGLPYGLCVQLNVQSKQDSWNFLYAIAAFHMKLNC